MENSWKAGHLGGEKRRGERGKRRGGTTGRSRVRSKRREKVRRTLLNKSSYNIDIVNRSIDLLTCQFFWLKIIQHFQSILVFQKVGQLTVIQRHKAFTQSYIGETVYVGNV